MKSLPNGGTGKMTYEEEMGRSVANLRSGINSFTHTICEFNPGFSVNDLAFHENLSKPSSRILAFQLNYFISFFLE